MLAWLWTTATLAAEPASTEEVIVYADDFARWDHTRWAVDTELLLPLGTVFGSDRNYAFRSHALQMHAVVLCDKDARLTKRAWEVMCAIEDIAILATSDSQWSPGEQPTVQQILDEVDAKLTGASIQLQVDRDGGVTNFDLEGLDIANNRQRELAEQLRRLTGRLMAGFHARIPDHAQRTGQWLEQRSALMDIPSVLGSRGSSELVHTVSKRGDLRIVQTLGKGTTAVQLDRMPADTLQTFQPGMLALPGSSDPLLSAGSSLQAPVPDAFAGLAAHSPSKRAALPSLPPPTDSVEIELRGVPNALDLDATFEMSVASVAVFARPTGIMTERVWVVIGNPTASSMGGSLSSAPYVYRGQIRLLSETDTVELGPSQQVAWPGYDMPGLSAWVPL